MPKYYPNNPEKDALVRKFLAKLKREARRPDKRSRVLMHGGPYNEQSLHFTDFGRFTAYDGWIRLTCDFRVGNHVGHYREVPPREWSDHNLVTRLPAGVKRQAVWESAS